MDARLYAGLEELLKEFTANEIKAGLYELVGKTHLSWSETIPVPRKEPHGPEDSG